MDNKALINIYIYIYIYTSSVDIFLDQIKQRWLIDAYAQISASQKSWIYIGW